MCHWFGRSRSRPGTSAKQGRAHDAVFMPRGAHVWSKQRPYKWDWDCECHGHHAGLQRESQQSIPWVMGTRVVKAVFACVGLSCTEVGSKSWTWGFVEGKVVPVLSVCWPLVIMSWTKALRFSTEAPTEAWLCSMLAVALSAKSDFAHPLCWVFSHHCSPVFVPRLSLEPVGPAVSLSCLALAADAKMLQIRKIIKWHLPSESEAALFHPVHS